MSKGSATKFGGAERGEEILRLPPEDFTLITDPGHCLYDFERANTPPPKWFIALIKSDGKILEPIQVRHNGKDADGKAIIHVVNGRQRVQAARILNEENGWEGEDKMLVPFLEWRGNDDEAAEAVVSFNEGRVLNTIAGKIARCRLLLKRNPSIKRAARVFCVSQQTIKNWMKIDDMSAEVQKAVLKEGISLDVVLPLAKLPREEQGEALEKLRAAGPLTGPKGKKEAEKAGNRGKAPERKQKRSLPYATLEAKRQELLKAPGRRSRFEEGIIAALAFAQGDETALDEAEAAE